MLRATFGIALFLQYAVAFTVLWVAAAVLLPVVGMLRLPPFLAVFLILSIIGVGSHFALLPAAFAGSLTGITVAIFLIFDSRIGNKEAAAMHTAVFRFHGLPPVETINRLS
jgi:hypothetical protein